MTELGNIYSYTQEESLDTFPEARPEACHKVTFVDAEGNVVETHVNWEVLIDFRISAFFDRGDRDCPACSLFMFCSSRLGDYSADLFVDPLKTMPCGHCQATEEVLPTSESAHGILIFTKADTRTRPSFFQLSKRAFDAVSGKELHERFKISAGHALINDKIIALLLAPKAGTELQTSLVTFAVLKYIQGKLEQARAKETS